MIGSVTMSNASRAIGRASTNGMPWTIWSPRDHRHRIAYAPSESNSYRTVRPKRRRNPALLADSQINSARKSRVSWKKSRVAASRRTLSWMFDLAGVPDEIDSR